jgi:hypothetical protein
MPAELFANQATSSLSVTMAGGDTSLVVVSSATFPTTAQFRILVDSELMLVTAVAGTTFTVTRAIEGTIAAAHTAGADVTHIVTAGALATIATPNIHRTSDANYDITDQALMSSVWFRSLSAARAGKLPSAPLDGMLVEVVDEDGSLTAAHTWTVDGNGVNIVNKSAAAATLVLNNVTGGAYAICRLRFSAAANVWKASLA